MNLLTSINEKIHNWFDLQNSINKIFDNNTNSRINIQGVYGSLFSHFTNEICKKINSNNLLSLQYSSSSKKTPEYQTFSSDLVIIVPTESEAQNIKNDFLTINPDIEVFIFPTWGTVPYRPVAKGSIVFGKRAGILSKMLEKNVNSVIHKKNRIFIFTQRSFLTSLPNPDFLKEKSFKLKKGDNINTTKIAEKLSSLGYIRVPRVSVRGIGRAHV